MWGEPGKDRDDQSWLLCTNRQSHEQERLMLTQIIAGDSLQKLGLKVHEIQAIWGITMHCGCPVAATAISARPTNGICKVSITSCNHHSKKLFIYFPILIVGNYIKIDHERVYIELDRTRYYLRIELLGHKNFESEFCISVSWTLLSHNIGVSYPFSMQILVNPFEIHVLHIILYYKISRPSWCFSGCMLWCMFFQFNIRLHIFCHGGSVGRVSDSRL